MTSRNAGTAWEKLRKKLRLGIFPFSIFDVDDDDSVKIMMMMLRRRNRRMMKMSKDFDEDTGDDDGDKDEDVQTECVPWSNRVEGGYQKRQNSQMLRTKRLTFGN